MTAALLDVFAFLSVLLRGAALTLNSLAIGGAAFLAWALRGVDARDVARPARRMVAAAAAGLAIVQASILAIDAAALSATAGTGLRDVVGANFFVAGLCGVVGAAAIAVVGLRALPGY